MSKFDDAPMLMVTIAVCQDKLSGLGRRLLCGTMTCCTSESLGMNSQSNALRL